jgi:hypothetical protein
MEGYVRPSREDRKKALLFEKRSKNFCPGVGAGSAPTERGKSFLVRFFKKELLP